MTVDEPLELHALVLAAGGSRRFGSPKQLLVFDGETLLHRICREALSVCAHVTVVLGARPAAMAKAIDDLPLMRIMNPDWRDGMASSLCAGTLSLPATADGVMILLCDQPAVSGTQMRSLMEAWWPRPQTIVASAYAGARGVPAIFPRASFARLMSLTGDRGARELMDTAADSVTTVAMPSAAYDIDTPADIERVKAKMHMQIGNPLTASIE